MPTQGHLLHSLVLDLPIPCITSGTDGQENAAAAAELAAIHSITAAALKQATRLQQLQHDNCSPTVLLACTGCSQLTSLSLIMYHVSQQHAEAIQQTAVVLGQLTSLRHLDLRSGQVGFVTTAVNLKFCF